MRIAYLINQYPKVSHSFIRREIQALEQQGVSVMRISIRGWDEALLDADDEKERKQTRYVLRSGPLPLIVAFFHLLLSHPARTFRALFLELRMARQSDRGLPVHLIYLAEACQILLWLKQADITHLHAHFGTNSAEVAMLVHILGGPPWSFTVHGPEEFDKPYQIGLAEKIRRANFVVAISSYGRGQLLRFTSHNNWNKLFVVYCGLEPEYFVQRSQLSESRELICIGRLCEQKGQLLLIEAARRLVDRGALFQLILAGDGELRKTIEELIKAYSLEKHVRITGWINGDEVRRELLAARALVLPSFAEGLPVVIMEAMALRRPVITTYVAGIPELVRETGWLVPAGDVEALVKAIEECLSASLEDLRLLGDRAFSVVASQHNIKKQAAKLALLFGSARENDFTGDSNHKRSRLGKV
jgi:colanic acid/amylovoran biosynthesis glycosyltransferase